MPVAASSTAPSPVSGSPALRAGVPGRIAPDVAARSFVATVSGLARWGTPLWWPLVLGVRGRTRLWNRNGNDAVVNLNLR